MLVDNRILRAFPKKANIGLADIVPLRHRWRMVRNAPPSALNEKAAAAERLLAWYDRHARILPWRAKPGVTADPYHVWLSEIMLQQTTVKAVIPYFEAFLTRWPDIAALAAAHDDEVTAAWAGLGYYSRARKLVACAREVTARFGGRFPHREAELLELPGIGPYTAAAIAAIAFGEHTVVVDGNVERVVARLFCVETPLPAAKPQIRHLAGLLTPAGRPGDYAQGVMDLGATICTPRRPACQRCPLGDLCEARKTGAPDTYPRKMIKPAKPQRRGRVFVVECCGHVLLTRRPPCGLLGGMLVFPGDQWMSVRPAGDDAPPLSGLSWRTAPQTITHVFTHFSLELSVLCARAPSGTRAPTGHRWWPSGSLAEAGLPAVMAKIARNSDVVALLHSGLSPKPDQTAEPPAERRRRSLTKRGT